MRYDVIIVGAGPSGTTTGYQLAKNGFKCLILEKEQLPRYKPCAGALSVRAADILDFDIAPAIDRVIRSIYFTHKFSRGRLVTSEAPMAYTVMRDKFDYLLARKAGSMGVEIMEEARVTDVQIKDDEVIVTADGQHFHGEVVVGADGSRSVVAQCLDRSSTRRLVVTMQSEVYVEPSILNRHSSHLWVDIGSVPMGYAWLFPKQDHLSVGVGILKKKALGLRTHFEKCLGKMVPQYESIEIYAHPLAIWGRKYRIAGERFVLVGDAAGTADPLTGEGIFYAIKSGHKAAEAIGKRLAQKQFDMTDYENAMKSELGQELSASMALSGVFYAFPRASHKFGLCNDRITGYFVEMMQGRDGRDYADFHRRYLKKAVTI